MKLLLALALAAAGVSAQTTATTPTPAASAQIPPGGDKNCQANYIVTQCLQTEYDKLSSCDPTDYKCLCAASQAIATCYNNCPSDARAPQATQAMNQACQNASLYAPKTTSSLNSTTSTATPTPTSTNTASTTGTGFSVSSPTSTKNAADALAGSPAGLLAAVAGILAAAL